MAAGQSVGFRSFRDLSPCLSSTWRMEGDVACANRCCCHMSLACATTLNTGEPSKTMRLWGGEKGMGVVQTRQE